MAQQEKKKCTKASKRNPEQAYRSAKNKRKRIERDAARKAAAKNKAGFVVDKGAARAKRREKQRWVKAMSTAKAKKAEQRAKDTAALHGGRIVALPGAYELAMVKAWREMNERRVAKQRRAA